MEKSLKRNSELILKRLKTEKQLCISDMVRDLKLKRCQVRVTVAYLLGQDKIEELNYGMAKVYFLK